VNISRSALLTFCLVLAVAVTATAAESKWKLPNLNPFSKKSSDKSTAGNHRKTERGLKLPKIDLWPNGGKTSSRRTSQPSTWAKFTTGTKNLFNKTKQALASPWSRSDKTDRSGRRTSGSPLGRTAKRPEKKSFFASWFSEDEEEPKRPIAPHEWLNQPRPRP
jgi:hypothetical protein